MAVYKPNLLDFGVSFLEDGFSGLKNTWDDYTSAIKYNTDEFFNKVDEKVAPIDAYLTGDSSNSAKLVGEVVDPSYSSDSSSDLKDWIKRLLDSSGAQIEEAQKNRDFQAQQAAAAMDFEAKQAAINREFQISSAREAMDFESREAALLRQWQEAQNQKAMDYQTEMSNTAYQRAVKDLRAAGLNPILAYTQGGASSHSGVTSSGASASGKTASGSSARGHAASGSQANVRGQINELTSAINDLFNSAGKIAGAFLKI